MLNTLVIVIGYDFLIVLSFSPIATMSEDPHCILVAFGGENYGEYARPLKRFAFIAIQYLLWLWTIPRNPKR